MIRAISIIIPVALYLFAVVATAQICPSPAPGNYPNYRPEGEPANYPPPGEPDCYMQTTQTASLPFCNQCHMPWRG